MKTFVRILLFSSLLTGVIYSSVAASLDSELNLPDRTVNPFPADKPADNQSIENDPQTGADQVEPPPETTITTIFSRNENDLVITYQSGSLAHKVVNGYDLFEIDDEKTELEGAPNQPLLPVSYLRILVPPDTRFERLDITNISTIELPGAFRIAPAPEEKPICAGASADGSLKYQSEIYTDLPGDRLWPDKAVKYVDTLTIRGHKILIFRVSPIQFTPDSGKVIHHEQIQFAPVLASDDPINLSFGAPADTYSSLVKEFADNPTDLLSLYQTDSSLSPTSPDVEYLIITNSTLKSNFQALADWKTARGTTAAVLATDDIYSNYSGSDNQEKIKSAIVDYATDPISNTVWVLLGGDDTVIPARYCYGQVSGSSVWTDTIPTDLYYAGLDDMDWDDNTVSPPCDPYSDTIDLGPDVFVGRAPVRTPGEADAFIEKVKTYVEDPPPDDFAEDMILMGEKLWNEWDGKSDSHWRSEELYNNYIDPYWGPVREWFYDTGTSFPGDADYDLTTAHVSDQINDGYNFLFMSTHGGHHAWATEGTPYFYSTDVYSLTNRGAEGIIYTIACHTNAFDVDTSSNPDPCLSEAFIRNPNGGAVAYIGSSRYGWGNSDPEVTFGTSFQYASQFYQQLFTGSLTSGGGSLNPNDYPYYLGAVHTGHKLYYVGASSDYGAMRWVQFSLNLMVDPEMGIRLSEAGYRWFIPLVIR